MKIEGIGTFNAKLGLRRGMLQDAFEEGDVTRNSSSIVVKGVSYRADNDLIANTSEKCTLQRGGVKRLRKSKYTLEQRIQKARNFLQKNMFMRVPDYADMTGLSRSTAALELRKLALDTSSGIASRGERSQKYYVLRE